MTRRKIIFTDDSGKQYVTPELNGDKTEFEKFQMGDTCTVEWADIMKLFADVSTLDEFKQANKTAQECYISNICPKAEPEPVEEITDDEVAADEIIYTGIECTINFTGINSTRFRMPDELISNKTIAQIYESVAQQMGVDISAVKYDCTKILISKNIQDKIYEAYELQYPDAFRQSPENAQTEVNMMMANAGPQMEKTLPDNTVVIENGFFVYENDIR